MSVPELMPVSEGPQCFDVFTGAGRRRRFTAGEKAAIVAESYVDVGEIVGQILDATLQVADQGAGDP